MNMISPVPLIDALGDNCRELCAVGSAPDKVFDDLAINGINVQLTAPSVAAPKPEMSFENILGSPKPKSFTR